MNVTSNSDRQDVYIKLRNRIQFSLTPAARNVSMILAHYVYEAPGVKKLFNKFC